MFQLIVAVISIALVAALAIASIYYGGSAFNKGSLRANVTTLVNAGQQISGAQALYRTDFGGVGATTVAALQAGGNGVTYLSAAPSYSSIAAGPWALSTDGNTAVIPFAAGTDTTTVCAEVVKQAGGGAQFFCSDAAGAVSGTAAFAFKL